MIDRSDGVHFSAHGFLQNTIQRKVEQTKIATAPSRENNKMKQERKFQSANTTESVLTSTIEITQRLCDNGRRLK